MEDDTGKVQLTVDLHESFKKIGELQSELTNMVRQSEVIQGEVKRITDVRDNVVNEKGMLEQQLCSIKGRFSVSMMPRLIRRGMW